MPQTSLLKIGVFDSGRGGLSIAQALQSQIPGLELVYWADSEGFPYSTKSGEFIESRLALGVKTLQNAGCKAVVVACNTASLYGLDVARRVFPNLPMIGTVPALKPALESDKKKVYVLATESSVRSPKFAEFLASFPDHQRVTALGLTPLVQAIEAQDFGQVSVLLHALVQTNDFRDSAVVLGCTHFPLVLEQFTEIFPKDVEFFSPTQGVVDQVQRVLSSTKVGTDPSIIRFIS